MGRCRNRFLLLLTTGVGYACGENEPSDPCTSVALDVTVEAAEPVFSWASACPAALLVVTPADSLQELLWSAVAAPGVDAIRGPVTYGVAPAGAAVMTLAEPLISGRQYRIQISRTDQASGLGFRDMGVALFTLP
jgi:hypothetical protein